MDLAVALIVTTLLVVGGGLLIWRATDLAAARQERRRHERAQTLRRELNEVRARMGLDEFPTLAEFQQAAEACVQASHPEGLRTERLEISDVSEDRATFYGIVVVPEWKHDTELDGVLIMGEFAQRRLRYQPSHAWGSPPWGREGYVNRGIVIYFSSFMEAYPFLPAPQVLAQLASTVTHEVQHLTDAEDGVPYPKSLARRDDEQRERWRGERCRHPRGVRHQRGLLDSSDGQDYDSSCRRLSHEDTARGNCEGPGGGHGAVRAGRR